MKINAYVTDPTNNSNIITSYWIKKFISGLRRHGLTNINIVQRGTKNIECDLSIMWGILYTEVIKYHRTNNSNFITVERGYTPNRSKWATCGFNGLNGLAEFNNTKMSSDRWDKHHTTKMLPWNTNGDYVLILGQQNGDTALYGIDVNQWAIETIEYFKSKDIPYVFRPHPGSNVIFDDSVPELEKAIESAYCVVTYNSSAGVESILRGKPTITIHPGSMVWNVTKHELKDYNLQYIPDRTQWANNFAYTQWLDYEIESGDTWDHLKGYLNYV